MSTQPIRIAITGASGWIGRNFLNYLSDQKKAGWDVELGLFSSKASQVLLINGEKWDTQEFTFESVKKFNPNYLVHLAFVTADYSNLMNREIYINKNKRIINDINKIIKDLNVEKVLFTSSGIQESKNQPERNKDYKELKDLESQSIMNSCDKRGIKHINLRIWSTTGNYMDKVKYFAISEFILKAIESKDILIKSANIVNRTYMDGEDIAKIGICALNQNKNIFIQCSTGSYIDLVQLANKVVKTLKSKSNVHFNINENDKSDNYFPNKTELNSFLIEHKLSTINLEQQVLKTANYVKLVK